MNKIIIRLFTNRKGERGGGGGIVMIQNSKILVLKS